MPHPKNTSSKPKPSKNNPRALTPRQLLFVEAYCGAARFVATEAYRMAGFTGNAKANAWHQLAKPHVAAAVAEKVESIDSIEVPSAN